MLAEPAREIVMCRDLRKSMRYNLRRDFMRLKAEWNSYVNHTKHDILCVFGYILRIQIQISDSSAF